MNSDYIVPSKVIVDMRNYVKEIVKLYPFNHSSNVTCPWNGMLFESNMNKKELTERDAEIFHTFVMKCMFLAKQGRPDVLTGISYLATKVLEPHDEDLKKLSQIISYLRNTINIQLTLEADDSQIISWYVDSSFGVHKDMKSHTGSIYTLGKGCIMAESTKQKVNTRSSKEANKRKLYSAYRIPVDT